MQKLVHNAILWCDHEGGTVLDKAGNPFSARLEMEHTFNPSDQKVRAKVIENVLARYNNKNDKRTVEEIGRDTGYPIDLKTKNKIQARFRYMTSPYSNGNLRVDVWCDGDLVMSAYDNPGTTYQYPSEDIKVTIYKSGPWEQFLLDKNYHKTEGKVR